MPENSKKLILGSVMRSLTLLANVIIGFFLMPFIIDALGDHWYGFWAIAGSLVGFYGLLDFGLSLTTQRNVAHALGSGRTQDVNGWMSTAVVVFSGAGLFIVIALIPVIMWVPAFIDDPGSARTLQYVIGILGLNVALSLPFRAFHGLLAAKLRFDLLSSLELTKLALRTALIIYIVGSDSSIVSLALITFASDLSVRFGQLLLAWYLHPTLKIQPRLFTKQMFAASVNYSKFVFLTSIAERVRMSAGTFIVGFAISASAVTHYAIALRLMDYLGQLVASIFSVVMPVFTKHHASDNRILLNSRFMMVSQLCAFFSILLGGLLIVMGDEFIASWMGPEYLDAYYPLVVLVAGVVLANSQRPSVSLLNAIAKHHYYAWISVFELVANVIVSLVLVFPLGLLGVALGTTIPIMITRLYLQPRFVCGQTGIRLADYYRSTYSPVTPAVPVFIGAELATGHFPLSDYTHLALTGAIVGILYTAITFKWFLAQETKLYLFGLLPIRLRPLYTLFT
ncbi:lipopolysaccharide biosynthesis protein [Thiohalomonas denitrificans]|uniref:lipopolysaccharide biosynthesis protein n=1 Tax=Thiohalomonas denitrificans TaxID=415747 RepID=UPI0026EC4D75|nr:oligosaccharide flippase family protein [Thiohalomonas denitrificans]